MRLIDADRRPSALERARAANRQRQLAADENRHIARQPFPQDGLPKPQRAPVNLRHWPGHDTWYDRPAHRTAPPLSSGLVMTVAAFAERGVMPERLGVGAFVISGGSLVLDAGFFHVAGLDRRARRRLLRWASHHPYRTSYGTIPLQVLDATAFGRLLVRTWYHGRATIVGTDLGRVFALLATTWGATGDVWWFGLPGWGELAHDKRGRIRWFAYSGLPWRVYVSPAGRYGVRVECGRPRPSKDGEPWGEWVRRPGEDGKGQHYRGRAVEAIALAASFDGVESTLLDDHLIAYGIPPAGRTYAADVNAGGAHAALAQVEAVRSLTRAVDADRLRFGALDPTRIHSAGSLADGVLDLMGLVPPLSLSGLTDAELHHWTAALRGGLYWADPLFVGMPFDGVDWDMVSAYPNAAIGLSWWAYVTAERFELEDVTEELRVMLARPDLAERAVEPALRRRWGLTRCALRLRGEKTPVSVGRGDDERLRFGPTTAERFDCAWPDAVVATVEAGRPVEVLEAVRVVPVGRQSVQPVRLLDRLVRDDVAAFALDARREAKRQGDHRLAAMLRLFGNALVYGSPSRFDGIEARPGPRCFPPLAAGVTALVRLDLVLGRRAVEAP